MLSGRRAVLATRVAFAFVALGGVLAASGCARAARESSDGGSDGVIPLSYAFAGVDGEVIDSSRHQGRVTVLLFVTTFDLASQVQSKRLQDLFRTHAPRINAAAVVLEAPKYVDLAREYRDQLGLTYDMAIVDKAELGRHEVLSRVRTVPTWIILDRNSGIVFVGTGALTPERLLELVVATE